MDVTKLCCFTDQERSSRNCCHRPPLRRSLNYQMPTGRKWPKPQQKYCSLHRRTYDLGMHVEHVRKSGFYM